MNLLIENLLNKQVLDIKYQDDGVVLSLSDGSIINLYNRIKSPINRSVIGNEITEVELDEKLLSIIIGNIGKIEMGMTNNDYSCPEAFFYHGADGVLISS